MSDDPALAISVILGFALLAWMAYVRILDWMDGIE